MKYEITRRVIGFKKTVEITEQEFLNIRACRKDLAIAIMVEEKFDMILGNFVDYEKELLDLTLNQSFFGDIKWGSFRDHALIVNRRLANVLTVTKMYIDQVCQDVGRLDSDGKGWAKKLERKMSKEYDSVPGYRIMGEMRNHMQHKNLPISGLIYLNEWQGEESSKLMECKISPRISIEALELDGGVKQKIIEDLRKVETSNRGVEVTPLVRTFVEGLGRVHEEYRRLSSKRILNCEKTIQEAVDNAQAKLGDKGPGLCIFVRKEDQGRTVVVDRENLVCGFIERRQKLEERNRFLGSIARRFVTSECALENA